MKLIKLLSASLLTLSVAAAKTSKDNYATFYKKSQSTPSVRLDDNSFVKLTAAPRNYTAAVLLTALEPRVGCQLCKEFQPEWDVLAASWLKGDKDGESRVLFGVLDFEHGRQTFQSFQLATAPVLFLFHPTQGPHAKGDGTPDRFDFSTGGQTAEMIHTWIARNLPDRPHPPVYRPVDWVRVGFLGMLLAGGITAIAVAWPYILPVLNNRNLWAGLSLIGVLLFTSGHMFNQIRGVPYLQGDGKGGIVYFAGGFQNQLGLESQIVAALYAVLSFATISLALKVPRMTDAKRQQVAVFVWGAVIFGVYSLLLSIFRVKNAGYPFWLPPF